MKTIHAAGAVVLLLALAFVAGCATRPGPEVLVPVGVEAEGARVVTVHAATTREPEGKHAHGFTTERARRTSYAAFAISVPLDHRPGSIEWPERRPPDPETSFAVIERRVLDEGAFMESVVGSSQRSGPREVNVFVHGYNQNFQQALFRLAQMTADAHHDGAAVLFAWPSQAQVAGYVADRDSVLYSRDHLVALLIDLAGERRVGEITVVAHSMGALLAVEALRQLRLTRRDDVLGRLHVVLASPDIDMDVFQAQMEVIGLLEPPLTVLVSPDDRALLVSRRVAGERDRLGTLDITDPRVEEAARRANVALVDISSLEATDGLRHARYAMLGAVYSQLEEAGSLSAGQSLQRPGAFVFNAVGTTLSSPLVLVGEALAGE